MARSMFIYAFTMFTCFAICSFAGQPDGEQLRVSTKISFNYLNPVDALRVIQPKCSGCHVDYGKSIYNKAYTKAYANSTDKSMTVAQEVVDFPLGIEPMGV